MRSLLQFTPLIAVLCWYAACVRFAARVIRASGVGWVQAFEFAGLVILLSVLGRVVASYVGQAPPLPAVLFGMVLHIALGAWFFKGRALAADGQPVGWVGGTKLTAIAIGLLFLTMLVLFGIVRALLSTVQP